MYEQLKKRLAATARNGSPVHLLRLRIVGSASEEEIVTFADDIARVARIDDVIGRMGYYDFVIIINGGAESIVKLCDRINALAGFENRLDIATITSRMGEEVQEFLQRLDDL